MKSPYMRVSFLVYAYDSEPDKEEGHSHAAFAKRLLPEADEHFHFLVFERTTGAFVDNCGIMRLNGMYLSWLEIGYLFRVEIRGKGHGKDFLGSFLNAYWALPRRC
jgi:RimJ/RimL family protein N-acetyltransferase